MGTQQISRVSAGVPDGGRFAPNGHPEADGELDNPSGAGECGVCGEPSDQDEGIPCSGCLEDHCACGASLDDDEGYDGECGSCADRTYYLAQVQAEEAEFGGPAAQTGPIEGSEEWSDGLHASISDEVRRQCPDAASYELLIDDDDEHSYDSLVRVRAGRDGGVRYLDSHGTPAADAITELGSYDDDFGTLHPRSFDMPAPAATDEAAAPEPERLHPNMGDGPIVTSPSGQYGFYMPVGGSEKADGIAKHGPVVQVAQLVNGGKAWSTTPARFYASYAADNRPGSRLAIDMGAGWALSAEDTQALATYGQNKLDEHTASKAAAGSVSSVGFMSEDDARALAAANPKPTGPRPVTDEDKALATTIYRQIGPIVAGNMDARGKNAFAIPNGVRMTGCRAGARKRVDVMVTLNGGDLYDIEVVSTPTLKADSKPIAKVGDVHVSQLQGLMLRIGDGHPEDIAA